MANVGSVTKFWITAQEGFTTTTSGSVASGATTVGLNSVSGYTNGDQVAFVIDPTDTNKKQTFTGTIDTSGVQVTSVVWTEGTNQTHAAGATVVDYTTATHQAALVKGLKVEHTAAGLHTLGSSSTITSSKVITSLNDTNGNELLKVTPTSSAVNEVTLTNAATGNAPTLSATGDDANIDINMAPKGTGILKVGGNPIRHGAWADWTPTLTNLSGGAITYAKYTQVGKTVHFRFRYALAGTGVGTEVTITLPVAPVADLVASAPLGTTMYVDASAGAIYQGMAYWDGTTMTIRRYITSTSGQLSALSATQPFTWATGDSIHVEGTYEAA
jgi:hypothetical protein